MLLIDDMTRLGGIVANLTDSRAMPDAVAVGTWSLYSDGIAAAYRIQTRRLRAAAHASA